MDHNPLNQFLITPIVKLAPFGLNLAFTNASLYMLIATSLSIAYILYSGRALKLIPSRLQSSLEIAHNMLYEMLGNSMEKSQSKKFLPLIFSIFFFVLSANLCGMLPGSFATTSQIIITFAIAFIIFFTITITGLLYQGLRFFKLFLPTGCPLWLAPIMIVIEFFSFLAQPLSLGLRLAANITSGHILLHVIAGAVVGITLVLKFLPFALIIVLIGFEFCVAILQAYIFAILSCVYLGNVLNSH